MLSKHYVTSTCSSYLNCSISNCTLKSNQPFFFIAYGTIGPFPLTQIVALIWVAIRIATQISATIFIFMCGDRKVAIIISAILIAIRAPLIVRLFENNRDYLKIIVTIFCAKCVRTVNENRTSFLYPIMQGGRSVLPVCVHCVFD